MMSIKNSLPDFLMGTNAERFADVLDGLNNYKQLEIAKALRIYNPLLCFDSRWLIKQATDFGFKIPEGYPWQPLQWLLMNAYSLTSLKGTKLGLEALIEILTLGEVTSSNVELNRDVHNIILDDTLSGFITGDESTNRQLYPVVSSDDFNPNIYIKITIETSFYQNNLVKDYVSQILTDWIPSFTKPQISLTWLPRRDGYYFRKIDLKFDNE